MNPARLSLAVSFSFRETVGETKPKPASPADLPKSTPSVLTSLIETAAVSFGSTQFFNRLNRGVSGFPFEIAKLGKESIRFFDRILKKLSRIKKAMGRTRVKMKFTGAAEFPHLVPIGLRRFDGNKFVFSTKEHDGGRACL